MNRKPDRWLLGDRAVVTRPSLGRDRDHHVISKPRGCLEKFLSSLEVAVSEGKRVALADVAGFKTFSEPARALF